MFDERVAAWNGKDVADLEERYALFPDDAALEAATTPALSGDAKAWRGRNVVAGDRITLHLADDRIVVEGAKAVLFPGEQGAPR